MKSITRFSHLFLALACSCQAALAQAPIDTEAVMRVAARKLAAHDKAHPEKIQYPTDAKGAKWRTVTARDWVSGFYPGTLWYMYEYARMAQWPDAEQWRQMAEAWTAGLTSQQTNDEHHDTGFVMYDSFGNGYRLTQNPEYLPIIKRTAQSLASRFRSETGTIRSWGKKSDEKNFITIMDNMMNLELLVWAAKQGGTTLEGGDLLKVATSHADRTIELFFRPDGGTCHVVDLDPSTGEVRRKRTVQGKADDSTWSRGQAWAMHGFAYMYDALREPRYLQAAITASDFYLSKLPADFVPPSDFDSTLTGLEFKDSSAAAIAASAMLRLSTLVDKAELKAKYFEAATKTLAALTKPPYFSEGDDKASLLVYSARNYHADPNHELTNTSLIWSDYYLLEALLRYQAITKAKAK